MSEMAVWYESEAQSLGKGMNGRLENKQWEIARKKEGNADGTD
jgi:hypothetical protein